MSAEAVATALGTTYFKASVLLLTARDSQRHAPPAQRPPCCQEWGVGWGEGRRRER
ncbi:MULTISPECIES: hypothetical protein [Streptomyces]|uniref:Uncharacterized protein n=1 Tax=Streptomyces virginiae TaxID=1961 RepID=A0ABZ1T348_STRVG|nr:hypothetical protein [Streptomyces virginiae]WTB20363.1 hypothetical protein OG253_02020 [Streptomyces virginiae]